MWEGKKKTFKKENIEPISGIMKRGRNVSPNYA